MTDAELRFIRELVQQAPAPPWWWRNGMLVQGPDPYGTILLAPTTDEEIDGDAAVLEFLAHSREAVPALLAEVERMDKALGDILSVVDRQDERLTEMDRLRNTAAELEESVNEAEARENRLRAEVDRLRDALYRAERELCLAAISLREIGPDRTEVLPDIQQKVAAGARKAREALEATSLPVESAVPRSASDSAPDPHSEH